jgi:hypothetical protein
MEIEAYLEKTVSRLEELYHQMERQMTPPVFI